MSDHDLFCKLCAPTHALNQLLPPARGRFLLIFIRNLFLSVVYIALSSEIVFGLLLCIVCHSDFAFLCLLFELN